MDSKKSYFVLADHVVGVGSASGLESFVGERLEAHAGNVIAGRLSRN